MNNLLLNSYQKRLNLQNATFSQIEHEDAMVALVYQVVQPTSAPLILKICASSHDYFREVYFLNFFAGTLPVPRIAQVVPPGSDTHGAILMEHLPGGLLKADDLNEALAYEIGSLLAGIHLNRVAAYGDLTQSQNLSPDPSLYFTLKFEEGFAECSHHLPKALLGQCRQYYDAHASFLTSVDGPCIIHRDFRPGNLIIDGGKLQGIIDWASGRASFAEEDFCPLEFGEWQMNSAIKKSFLAGYKSTRPVPNYNAIMPLLQLSRAIAVIGFTVKRGTWDDKNARVYHFNRRFLDTFF
jgi:Ser/Thr protein kinase RdoA (MazF antagonist)